MNAPSRRRVIRPTATEPMSPEKLLANLNPEQRRVVTHHLGALLVGAIAGSGKTTALVSRIAYLYLQHGVAPKRVLAVTFSKKAAEEMTLRLARLLPGEVVGDARVGTFHSLGYQFLREEFRELNLGRQGGWNLDQKDRYTIAVKDALGFRGMNWMGYDLTVVLQFIGQCKANCALPQSEEALRIAEAFHAKSPCMQRSPHMLAEAYGRAEMIRVERRIITFDDILLMMWDRLRSDATVRARWAARWDFVMQDEAQDENLVQRLIAGMLSEPHGNYMIVGDPAQSIYGFRGADPSGILTFKERWNAEVVEMHRNYRSGSSIVKIANGALAAMSADSHLGMTMTPERGVDGRVSLTYFSDVDGEAQGVAQQLLEAHADGTEWKDMVCLYRTNAQSRSLEEQLLGSRIPYVVIGGTNFYDRKEVKDILAYLRLAAGRGDFEDVRRSINAPFRFLGRAFVERVESMALRGGASGRDGGVDWTEVVRNLADSGGGLQQRQRMSAHEWCGIVDGLARRIADYRLAVERNPLDAAHDQEAKPASLIEGLLTDTKYVAWLTQDEGSESPENNRVSNIRELVRASERFNTVDGLLDYIEENVEAARRAKLGEEGNTNRVTMMSIHRSKGLEWANVYLVGCSEKILPHARCEVMDEERRLFYVAATRARDELHVSYVGMASVGARVMPLNASRFIEESGLAEYRKGPVSESGEFEVGDE